MSRRASHVNVAAIRKVSDPRNKRVSLKDGTLGTALASRLAPIADIKEGDTFYRTVRIYPSIPDCPEEVIVTIAKLQRESRSGSSAEIRSDSRRGSVIPAQSIKEEAVATPGIATISESPNNTLDRAASIAASAGGADSKRPKLVIWPEWSDADVNAEKWDVPHKGKEKDKGKSPVVQHLFDDPEGKIEMPQAMKVDHWKRIQDYVTEKTPVVVDPDGLNGFDLITNNEHLHNSEYFYDLVGTPTRDEDTDVEDEKEEINNKDILLRYIISQISALWEMSAVKNPPPDQPQPDPTVPYEEFTYTWKPWEHIYAIAKVQKGPHVPPFNPYGKYAVRIYWMGCWRKVIVDDTLPFDENDQLLLPATTMQHEIWPMLLAKALIKVASLDYNGGSQSSEFGDFSVVNCLTGWLPEAIPLQGFVHGKTPEEISLEAPPSGRASPLVTTTQVLDKYFTLSSKPPAKKGEFTLPIKNKDDVRYGHINEVWELLKSSVPEWKLPEQEWEKQLHAEEQAKREEMASVDLIKDEKSDKDTASKDGKMDKPDGKGAGKDGGKDKGKDAKDKDKGKDGKDKKDKDKDKKGEKEKTTLEETPLPEHPEVVVFASYWSPPKYPAKVSVLGEMADASEKLRQNGLSHIYPHPVWITQTRSCPLEPPPPPEKIPAWKLIRPRKKKPTPHDEPVSDPEPPKPIQCLEITSPFVNYKVSPVPIPTDTHRPKSALERGGTRSRPGTGSVQMIEETDENAPEPEPGTEEKEPETQQEEPVVEAEKVEEKPVCATPPPKEPKLKGRKSSANRKDELVQEMSPKLDRKTRTPVGKERGKSAGKSECRTGKKEDERKEKEMKSPSQMVPSAGPSPSNESAGEGGLAPPPPDADQQSLEGEEAVEGEDVVDLTPKPKKVWMDFEQFCRCFKTLYIYHKPSTYPCNTKHSDLKSVAPPATSQPTKGDKKPAQTTAGVIASPSKTAQTPIPHMYSGAPSPVVATNITCGTSSGYDDRSPHYLFVDNLLPTEIVVSFSSLSRWHDPPPLPVEEKKSHSSMKGGKDKSIDEKELTTFTSSSVLEGSVGGEQKPPPAVQPGTLVAEPYSWKSLVTGQPILRLRTTSIRGAVLSLPAGRHVLKFMMQGPLGYHVHLCSSVSFVFGDEETVMSQLTKESCRFVENASQVVNGIGKCITNFHDTELFRQSWKELVNAHCPYKYDKLMSKQAHFQMFNDALYATLRKYLRDIASPEIAFAWRALLFDATTKNPLGLGTGSRPATGQTSHRGSAKAPPPQAGAKGKQQAPPPPPPPQTEGEPEKTDHGWINREPTTDEHVATVKIQKNWRATWVRKIKTSRTPGTEENVKVQQNLQKCWPILEQNVDPNNPDHPGLYLFRRMFKAEPDIMPKYPFYQDEWNKISYSDYQGQFPDQPANSWFVVFREVFFVMEEMLAVPKLYVPINTCMLRVINNDTGEDLPRVFQKVAPYIYKKNKKGYTFVAEARTTEMPLQSGKWRMRLIGSLSPLPSPLRNEVNSNFYVREIRDYYIPNSKNVIFRYSVKVTEDHLGSIQVNTSKTDVYVKLVVLDNEDEVASTQGKGHAVIPAFTFLKDINPEEDPKRSGSRASNKGGKGTATSGQKGKRSGSGKSQDGRGSRSSQVSGEGAISDGEIDEKDLKPHKYIIQAVVLKDSWPLSESSWAFVQMLREMEKNELKVAFKEKQAEEPPKAEKAAASADKSQKGKGAKGGKDKGGKDKDKDTKGSRPPSQQFDLNKPHWTLRVVSDASCSEDIEVKKDTERADEIRAMKKAWEDAEPGRAAKAMQSRLKYLNTHTIKLKDDDEQEGEKSEVEGEAPPSEPHPPQTPGGSFMEQDEGTLTLEPPAPPTPKEMLQPIDLSQFRKKGTGPPRYLDEEEMERKFQEQQAQILQYKSFRQQVEQWREQDKQERNKTKQKQLEKCEELQAMLDEARKTVNEPREAFRQKYLEAERKRQEELAAQEAALKAEAEKNSPKGKKGSAKGKKSPAGGKKKK